MSTGAPDPDYFVQLPFTVNEQALADIGTEYLRGSWTDWEPDDGDPEIRDIEAHAAMFANACAIAAQMPGAALRAYATKLLGIPYGQGYPATTNVTLTMQDNTQNYPVRAGMQIAIDGYAFAILTDATTTAGDSGTLLVAVNATANSTAFNGLTGVDVVPISMPSYVTDYEVMSATIGGVDPQTDLVFQSDVSEELRFNSRAVITLPDFERAAVAMDGILRAHAETTGARDVTVYLLSDELGVVSDPIKDALAVVYATRRLTNVTVVMDDPTFTAISVAYAVTGYPGFDPTDLETRCDAALSFELSPTGSGAPNAGDQGNLDTSWVTISEIDPYRLATVLSGVDGVYEVSSIAINGGSAWAPHSLSGGAPLPTPGTMTGTITFP